MAITPSQADLQSKLDDFKTKFNANNTKIASNVSGTNLVNLVSNNTVLVNSLLDSLFGSSEEAKKAQALLSSTTVSSPSAKTPTPTYNTRTPYVELALNGVQVLPMTAFDGKDVLDINFSDISLEMPMGGMQSTISGILKLYTRTPAELLAFLVDDLTGDGPGLPTVGIKMGWKIAKDSNSQIDILSPILQFLVTNIEMEDPGRGEGTTLTLFIQDAGSAVMQNSSADLGVIGDYPQEQLRVLIEGILGLRLFTLDDLLYLGNQNQTDLSNKKTFFVTEPSAPFRINSNTLEIAIENILTQIKCRWFPVSNSQLSDARKEAAQAINDIATIKGQTNLTASQKQSQIAIDQIKLANTCSLIWIPSFPAGIQTSSQYTYIAKQDMNEPGAFILVPNPLSDTNIDETNLPLIYGPGGSSSPYFFGAAQNILQAAIENKKLQPGTYGDVISLNVNYSSLLALMKASVSEQLAYVETGKMLAAQNVSVVNKSDQEKAVLDSLSKDTDEKVKKILAAKTAHIKKFRSPANNLRFKKIMAPRSTLYGDSVTAPLADSNLRTYSNALSVDQEAMIKLKTRIASFVNYPITIGMSVLGDPFLLRQGIGAFELINYYPNLNLTELHFNYFVSGVYCPVKITHKLSTQDYTTEIQAYKIPDKKSKINNSFKEFLSSNNFNSSLLNINLDLPDPNANPFTAASNSSSVTTTATDTQNTITTLLNIIKSQQSN